MEVSKSVADCSQLKTGMNEEQTTNGMAQVQYENHFLNLAYEAEEHQDLRNCEFCYDERTQSSVTEDNGSVASLDKTVLDNKMSLTSESDMRARCMTAVMKQRGILLSLISAFCMSLGAVAAASLSGSVGPNEITFSRMVVVLLCTCPVVVYRQVPVRNTRTAYGFLLLRSILGVINTTLLYLSYQLMPVASAKSIQYTTSVFTGLLGFALLKDPCSFLDTIFSFLTVGGVFLIAQPPFLFASVESAQTTSEETLLGSIISLFCAFLSALILITLRKLNTYGIPSLATLFVFSNVSICFSALLTSALRQWTLPGCGLDRIALIGNGLLTFISQIATHLALKTERPSRVSILLSTDILFSFVLEFLFFGIVPNYLTGIGAIVILCSSMGVTINKLRESQRNKQGEEERTCSDEDNLSSNEKPSLDTSKTDEL